MKKDTKPYEQLLAGTKANLKIVRAEIIAGAPLEHVYNDLQGHEQTFSTRLTDLKEWNKGEDQRAKKQADADRAAKLEEARKTLLATPIKELKKIAAGQKAVIEIKADTTVEQIVDAILKTAPENL